MKTGKFISLLLVLGWSMSATGVWAFDFGWMQKGVRVWYFGAVDGGGVTSSNAEEAYLLESISGANVQVKHHSGLNHWTSGLQVGSATYSPFDKSPAGSTRRCLNT